MLSTFLFSAVKLAISMFFVDLPVLSQKYALLTVYIYEHCR